MFFLVGPDAFLFNFSIINAQVQPVWAEWVLFKWKVKNVF